MFIYQCLRECIIKGLRHIAIYIAGFINEIEKEGIQVIKLPKNRYKFMIVDNKTVWYGGIDILGGSYNDNSLIRIEDEDLANELLGVISESRS